MPEGMMKGKPKTIHYPYQADHPMSVMPPLKQFQMIMRTKRGRPSVILKGDVNEKAAWQLLKQLEKFQPALYPINLNVDGVGTVHWFAAKLLKAGFEHLLTTRGEIFLIQKRKKPQPISQGDFLPIISSADGGRDEV